MAKALSERVLLALVLTGFLAGLLGLSRRHQAEEALAHTEILLDSQALSDWQLVLTPEEAKALPGKLIANKISSVAFGELHLEDLVERGLATPFSYQEFELALEGGGLISPADPQFKFAALFNEKKKLERKPGCYLFFGDPKIADDVARTLDITLGKAGPDGAFTSDVAFVLPGRVLFVPMAVRQLRLRSLGFEAETIAALARTGFSIWIRPENAAGLSKAQIDALFAMWKKDLPNVQGVIFGGALNEVIGYPDELEATAEAFKRNDWKLGYIELPERAQQEGIESLVRALPDKTVRVMAVSPAHQEKLDPYRVLGMYSLGARERNLRVLYVRPFAVAGKPELDEDFLFALDTEVAPIGPADTFKQPSPPPHPAATAVIGLGAGALCLLLLQAVGIATEGLWAPALLLVPVVGGLAAGLVGKSVLFRSLLALAVGMGGPTLAFLRWVYPVVQQRQCPRGPLAEGARLLLLCSLASLLTGLWVASLIPDTTFLLGLDRFRGVKLLTLLTPVIIVVAFLWKRYTPQQWRGGLMSSVKVYQAVLMGALLGAFGILLLRTGNEAGATASDSERYLRVVLDQTLGVRPRFKEFLLAHPAMLCTPLVALRLGFLPALLMVLVAAIGQAGIVDTFAHVHTPLDVTLIRVVLGVVFGYLFGLAAYVLARRWLPAAATQMVLSNTDEVQEVL